MSDEKIIGFHKIGGENAFLSNWFPSPFELEGGHFTCVEQYMMYRKAALFHDDQAMNDILATDDPEAIKSLGRDVRNYDDAVWSGQRQIIVYRGLQAKFEQNTALRENLLATGDAILAECAQEDPIWGIGLSMTDERRLDPKQWKGQNLLGYTLMDVREQLQLESDKRKEKTAHVAVYQCKLCGSKFQYGGEVNSNVAVDAVDAMGDRFDAPAHMMPTTIGHHCYNGAYGIAEFLGYEILN